jgi:hypothetical protein
VLKVYAAVVGTDKRVERDHGLRLHRAGQLAEWLSSLPPQRSLDQGRRDRIVREVRSAL